MNNLIFVRLDRRVDEVAHVVLSSPYGLRDDLRRAIAEKVIFEEFPHIQKKPTLFRRLRLHLVDFCLDRERELCGRN